MTADGSFLKIHALPEWKKGQLVFFETKPAHRTHLLLVTAACFLFFVLFAGTSFHLYYSQTELVSIDINPALEIGFNRFQRVISIQARNSEGEEIINEIDLINKTPEEAVSLLFSAPSLQEYLPKTQGVIFTVFSTSEKREKELLTSIQTITETELSKHHLSASVECHSVNKELVDSAHIYGVTAGKYLYLEELLNTDPKIDIEHFCNQSIGKIKKQIKICQNHQEAANTHNTTQEESEKGASSYGSHHRQGHHK